MVQRWEPLRKRVQGEVWLLACPAHIPCHTTQRRDFRPRLCLVGTLCSGAHSQASLSRLREGEVRPSCEFHDFPQGPSSQKVSGKVDQLFKTVTGGILHSFPHPRAGHPRFVLRTRKGVPKSDPPTGVLVYSFLISVPASQLPLLSRQLGSGPSHLESHSK